MIRKLALSLTAALAIAGAVLTGGASAQGLDPRVEHARISQIVQACFAENARTTQARMIAAGNGHFIPPPSCFAHMEGWIARMWYLEAVMQRQRGVPDDMCRVNPIRGCPGFRD